MKIDKIPVFVAAITVATIFVWFSSCKHDLGIPAGTPEVCFDSLVMPIFQNNCTMAGCHDGISGESHWTLTTYEDIMRGITPFNPDQSHYYIHLIGKAESLMPPGRPLSLDNRTIIRLWILQGALHTTCSGAPPVKK
jgi:hypothetical protein